jgi:hypothetical protein
MKRCSRIWKRIGCVSPSSVYGTSSPRSSARTTWMYSRNGASRIGLRPSRRSPVWPVPKPMKQRPGARRLMVAMPFAVVGASRRAGTFTPVPRRMRRVACAASASTAQQLERIIGLSVTQQWLKPRFSACVM